MVKTKVFVGNLSFKTTEADLSKEFEVAGKVATTNIISRGSRSLGYGFVEMESEEEAKKAVEMLNKKVIDGRDINVELAKPPSEEDAANKQARPRRERAPRAPRAAGANAGNNGQAGGQAGGEGEGEAAPRAPRRRPQNRRRGPRKQNADGTPAAGGEGAAAGGAPAQPKPKRERAPRPPRADAPPRVAAPNTLFVANLPFSVDDAGLAQIFAGLNLKEAHVARKRNDRSKGFGFVEFHSEEEQKKALAAVEKKIVENRELIVKLARTDAPGSPAVVVAEAKKDAAPASPKTA